MCSMTCTCISPTRKPSTGTDGDQDPLVLLEGRAQQGLELVLGQLPASLASSVRLQVHGGADVPFHVAQGLRQASRVILSATICFMSRYWRLPTANMTTRPHDAGLLIDGLLHLLLVTMWNRRSENGPRSTASSTLRGVTTSLAIRRRTRAEDFVCGA